MDAVADGTLPAERAGELVLLVAAWVDPEAHDETACRVASRAATREAIDDALAGAPAAAVRAIADGRDAARNAFYGGS
jgi:formaldehyde-activating enzyme